MKNFIEVVKNLGELEDELIGDDDCVNEILSFSEIQK